MWGKASIIVLACTFACASKEQGPATGAPEEDTSSPVDDATGDSVVDDVAADTARALEIASQTCPSPAPAGPLCQRCGPKNCCKTYEAAKDIYASMSSCLNSCMSIPCQVECFTADRAVGLRYAEHSACLRTFCSGEGNCFGPVECYPCWLEKCQILSLALLADLDARLLLLCRDLCVSTDRPCLDACMKAAPVNTQRIHAEWIACAKAKCTCPVLE